MGVFCGGYDVRLSPGVNRFHDEQDAAMLLHGQLGEGLDRADRVAGVAPVAPENPARLLKFLALPFQNLFPRLSGVIADLHEQELVGRVSHCFTSLNGIRSTSRVASLPPLVLSITYWNRRGLP